MFACIVKSIISMLLISSWHLKMCMYMFDFILFMDKNKINIKIATYESTYLLRRYT